MQLKTIVGPRAAGTEALEEMVRLLGGGIGVEDTTGRLLLGERCGPARLSIEADGAQVGWVTGPEGAATQAVAEMVRHLAAKECERRALAGEVLHLYREVHLIEQLSEQLAALLDLAAVGRSALEQAHRMIAATSAAILVLDEAGAPLRSIASFGAECWGGVEGFVGAVLERGVGEIVNEVNGDARLTGLGEIQSLMCVPLRAKQRAVGAIVMGHEGVRSAAYSTADLKLLNTIALQTAAAIENSLLCAEMVGAARDREQLEALQKELDTARTIQLSLVPRTFPPFPERTDFEIHAQMTAAKSVGGDFFDFFLLDEDRLGVVIGDVSGKGIPAALYMAVVWSQIKSVALEGMAPEECVTLVNRTLVREKRSSMFATCFYGILNTKSGEFQYCNAGHNPPHLLRAEPAGTSEALAEGGGLPLGLFGGLPYKGSSVWLRPGDSVFLFTDGVPEANNSALEDFTDERLEGLLRRVSHLPCTELVSVVHEEVAAFVDGAPQSDDITVVALRALG